MAKRILIAACIFLGAALIFADGGQALGFALLGFFGAGAFVLGRKGLGLD